MGSPMEEYCTLPKDEAEMLICISAAEACPLPAVGLITFRVPDEEVAGRFGGGGGGGGGGGISDTFEAWIIPNLDGSCGDEKFDAFGGDGNRLSIRAAGVDVKGALV